VSVGRSSRDRPLVDLLEVTEGTTYDHSVDTGDPRTTDVGEQNPTDRVFGSQ